MRHNPVLHNDKGINSTNFGPSQLCTTTTIFARSIEMRPFPRYALCSRRIQIVPDGPSDKIHSSPYEEGKILTVNVTEGLPRNKRTIQLRILRLIQPNTLSCVMEVEAVAVSSSTKHTKHSILKLYDWRYATQLRQDHRVGQWTPYHENTYRAFVEEGGAAKFVSTLEDTNSIDDQPWDTARDEAFLFDYCRDLHNCEVEAYDRLKDLQGKNVPRLLTGIRFHAFPTQNPFFEVRGILLELITGYSLADLTKHACQSSWQRICDETIRIINLISDHGILNEDVKPRNVLVRTHVNLPEYEIFVIDFAQCRFREVGQPEAAWRHEKWRQDEEGAIGYVMAQKLKGAFEYKPSYRFLCTCTKCTDI